MGHRTCRSTILFVVSYSICTIFIQHMKFKLNILVFLIMASQKLVMATGATIRDNTVYGRMV